VAAAAGTSVSRPLAAVQQPRDVAPVDGEVERAASAHVIERRFADVEHKVLGAEHCVACQLACVARAQLGPASGRHLAEGEQAGGERGEVRAPAQDRVDDRIRADAELPDDLVGVTVGLGGLRPLAKPEVAYEAQLVPRPVGGNPVRAGSRQRTGTDRSRRGVGGDDVCVGERELVEQLWVGPAQAQGDRAAPVVGDHPAREVAAGGPGGARVGAEDRVVERRADRSQAKDPLE
jgi:hypothetical protein